MTSLNEQVNQLHTACACLDSHPGECARRRDGEEWYDTHRQCECACHEDYYEEDEFTVTQGRKP